MSKFILYVVIFSLACLPIFAQEEKDEPTLYEIKEEFDRVERSEKRSSESIRAIRRSTVNIENNIDTIDSTIDAIKELLDPEYQDCYRRRSVVAQVKEEREELKKLGVSKRKLEELDELLELAASNVPDRCK